MPISKGKGEGKGRRWKGKGMVQGCGGGGWGGEGREGEGREGEGREGEGERREEEGRGVPPLFSLHFKHYLMVTVSGNPNPTNPTTKYRYEFDNLNCIFPKCKR